jgi:hypothetical protein
MIFTNNGTVLQEKLAESSVTQESTTQNLFINSFQNSSLITEAKFIEKSQFQELTLTLETTFSGMKLKRMFQKLLLVVLLFHLFSQINNGLNKVTSLWTGELFITLTWSLLSRDAKKLLETMNPK